MSLIKRYPEGSDISLLNVIYQSPRRNEDTGKYEDDYIILIYKDNITGEKHQETIYKPDYEFYIANDDVQIDHHLAFIDKRLVHPVKCRYTQLEKTLAELTGQTDLFYNNIQVDRKLNKQFHFNNYVFGSDVHIEDHYFARFDREYMNKPIEISKAYFDIEVDTIDMAGDFPYPGECPINAVSYIEDKNKSINVFLLRNPKNPQIEEFENVLRNPKTRIELFKELEQFIIENSGGYDKYIKFGLDGFQFNFNMYDEEIHLIQDLFITINRNKPDFLLAWNMAFDIPYIIERIKILGYDPAIIMSDPNFKEKFAKYYIDEKHKNDYELRGDYYKIASTTVYLDQLIQFASRRKGQAAFPNYKLDTAADIITKGAVRKLDYSHITTNLTKLPYLAYKIFVFYNIMDTLAQKCIESSVNDIGFIYTTCILNNTRYSKGHRQTVYLAGGARKFYEQEGFIMGNNVNLGNGPKFAGALVGDPTHNSDYGKMKIFNIPVNLFNNMDDFDFKSLYPSITREHNMGPNTQIGKIKIPQVVHEYENPYDYEYYDRGGQYIEDLTSGNILEFSRRWLHLASVKEMISDMEEYFTTVQLPVFGFNYARKLSPYQIVPEQLKVKPFIILDEGEKIKPYNINPDNNSICNAFNLLNRNTSL